MYTAGSQRGDELLHAAAHLRRAGAPRAARQCARKKLGVPVEELTTEPSVVVHAKSGRTLSYGEIAAFAEVPAKAPEIKPEQLKKPARLPPDRQGRDAGRAAEQGQRQRAIYGIDVQVPGMLYGAVLRAPVEGSAPDKFDDAKAKAVAGVIKIIKLPHGVGVVAETPWAAFAARQALDGRASPGARTGKAWGFDSDKGHEAFAADARDLATQRRATGARSATARRTRRRPPASMEAEYRCDYAYHAQMEPLNAVASVRPRATRPRSGPARKARPRRTEAPAKCARHFARQGQAARPADGRRLRPARQPRRRISSSTRCCCRRRSASPVKVMWTREDDVHNGRFRPLSAHYLRAGFDASGKLTAWHHRLAATASRRSSIRCATHRAGGKDGILMAGTDLAGYDVPHQLVEQLYQDTGVRTAPLRGIGFTRQQVRDRSLHGRDRGQARHRSARVPARAADKTPRAPTRWSSAWRRWRTGAASATAGRSGLPISTIPARRSPASPKCRSIAPPGRSRCMISGARSTAASRCSPTTSSRRPKAASSTVSAWR